MLQIYCEVTFGICFENTVRRKRTKSGITIKEIIVIDITEMIILAQMNLSDTSQLLTSR